VRESVFLAPFPSLLMPFRPASALPEDPARLQARLAGTLEVALDCIVTIDAEGKFIDFNPAAERTFGYRKGEVIGLKMADLIVPPSLRDRHNAGLHRLAEGNAPRMLGQRIEISAMRRDGSEFPVELAITRIDLGPETPPVFTAHIRDITSRKQTENALLSLQQQLEERIVERTSELRTSEASLRESQEMFAHSFHANPAVMWIARLPDGGLMEVNNAFERAFGLTKQDVLDRTTAELGLWEKLEKRDELLGRFRTDGVVRDFEARFMSVAGPRTWLLSADRIEVAGAHAILMVAVDISERRLREDAEAALARAEANYRSIFENALEGLYQFAPDGRFLQVNPAFARMFGYGSADELIESFNSNGRLIYTDPRRRDTFFELLGWHDQIVDFQSEVSRQDGSRFWISESVRAVRSTDGALQHLEGVAIDITVQREAARAMAEAREAADAANRAKSQFLASMSHELRTPLNGILGYTQILERDPGLSAPQQRGIRVIHQSAEHLLSLINDVLDLSKVEAGRLELHPLPSDLRALLAGVAELLAPRAHAQGLGFATDLAADLALTVLVDANRLRQVLLNLLGNALKFTRSGTVLFSAQKQNAASAERAVILFSVSDTGPGIDPADMEKLFQPFVQLSASGRAVEGTGLGLAISQSLVQALGGKLQVESKLGWGSRFWFVLELQRADPRHLSTITSPRKVIGYEGPRVRLLVVDDNPANREVLTRLVQEVGFEVETALSGEEALEQCGQELPALVLLDLRMEGISGLETATLLRRQYGNSLRIVAVSASAYDLDRQACLEAGCDDFVAKPVRVSELWRTLGTQLGLTWTYATDEPSRSTAFSFAGSTAAPPPEALRDLYEFAKGGDIVGLRACAQALAIERPEHADFASRVLDLADNFKLKAVRQLLKASLPESLKP
jgi:PAS domain S-box-containing protein